MMDPAIVLWLVVLFLYLIDDAGFFLPSSVELNWKFGRVMLPE